MDRLMLEFLQDCETRGLSPRSLPGYKSALKTFDNYLQGRGLGALAVDREILRSFIEHSRGRGLSQRTLELIFSVLGSFYEYMIFEGRIERNPIPEVRKRYLRKFKDNGDSHTRQLVSVEDAARIINAEMSIRDKAIITLLFKTGIRRNELITLDVSDVDLIENRIRLKPTPKRSNRTVFFDDEAAFILRRWLNRREDLNHKGEPALFLSNWGGRISRNDVYIVVTEAAKRVGLHDPTSERMEDHFSPHCCRHWFTTHLRRAGMAREFIQELRGDARREAIDIYDHIDEKELKEAYLACVPRLGI